MREDMFKIIVERPRSGSRHAPAAKLRKDRHPGRSHVGHKRMAGEQGYTKYLNENLSPLKRYLHKQVGRKWDKVFSEICEHLDTGSTVKMHVREHIDDFIVTKVSYDRKGRWLSAGSHWHSHCEPSAWSQDLYVDPCDGIIKRTADLCEKLGVPRWKDRWRRRKKKLWRPFLKKLSETEYLVKLDGIWFKIWLDKSPRCNMDLFLADLRTSAWRSHALWAVVQKDQLSGKALRKLGLENGDPEEETGA
ncbi:MAG: hypothetical protein AAFX02_02855 [Pseudomonadota bacterium]